MNAKTASPAQNCPNCGNRLTQKAFELHYAPFCSVRCKMVDLGRWFNGSYRIPTQEQPEEDALDKDSSEDKE